MSEGAREDPERSAALESSGEVHLFLDDAIANGEKVRSRRLRNISSYGGLDLMVEDSDMESVDDQPMAYEDDCAEEEDDSAAGDETGLLKRCAKVLSDIYALGLEDEIEGEHINIILRELMDEIDAAVAGNILYKEVEVVPKKEMPKEDTQEKETAKDIRACENCGKKIGWDEFCNNFGWCDECMGIDLDKYRRTHPEPSEVSEKF